MRKLTRHDKFSFVKSGIRIAGFVLLAWNIYTAALVLCIAEVLGIAEEL